jgi:hypothetical protein
MGRNLALVQVLAPLPLQDANSTRHGDNVSSMPIITEISSSLH